MTAKAKRATLSRAVWIKTARKVLEKKGIAEVKIDRLAQQLKVTRGGFYCHFSNLKDLHNGLLEEWRIANCQPFLTLHQADHTDGLELFTRIVHTWVDEKPFSPALDLAVRNWSHQTKSLAEEVKRSDHLRLALLGKAFELIGYDEEESTVRARITYFHQIGQYALDFEEPAEVRKRYQPLFGQVLLGPLITDPNLDR